MVADPVQAPTLDLGEDDGLAQATKTIDLDDKSPPTGTETPEQTEAREHIRAQRISSGIRLTEREQFQMYKAETGHGANVINLRPHRHPDQEVPLKICPSDVSSPIEAHPITSPSAANGNNINQAPPEAISGAFPGVGGGFHPVTLADKLALHEASARSDSPVSNASNRATPGNLTPDYARGTSAGFPFSQDASRDASPGHQLHPTDSNDSSAFSSRAPTMSTMGDASPSLERSHNMQGTYFEGSAPNGQERSPAKNSLADSILSDATVRQPPVASPISSPSRVNESVQPLTSPTKQPPAQPPTTTRTPSQTRPAMDQKKSVLGKLFPGKEEKKEREREREQKKQAQLQEQRERAAANGNITSEDSGAESETTSEKSRSSGFGRLGRRMSGAKKEKDVVPAGERDPSLSRSNSRTEDGGKLERKASQKQEGGTSLRDMVSNSMTRKLSTTSRKSDDGKSDTESHYGKSDKGGNQTNSLLKKYGACEKTAIGKGATAVVRLAHKWDKSTEKLYAVKEFRKRRKNETEKEYVKKLTSEFCISSTLHHPNIVETVDLVQDENHHWCEVMEYCPGGDLYGAIKKGGMTETQIRSYFYQMIAGVAYLHSMGVAHRDIKPENLLLDVDNVLKITDFGVSDVFRMCWEKTTHLSKGLCGSEPYIAPEQFEPKAEYDARLVDVWACAVVFYCMQHEELPWRVAKDSDPSYALFRDAYNNSSAPPPLGDLHPKECRAIVKQMLNPNPKLRATTDLILKDPWMIKISQLAPASCNVVPAKMPGNPQVKTPAPAVIPAAE